MDPENNRRGACDRCRGQKLRCVGSGRPVPNPGFRFQRNEIPCERCKRAKVECYSVRPAQRRAGASDRYPNQASVPPHSTITGSEISQTSELLNRHLRSDSTRSNNNSNDEQSSSSRQAEDIDSLTGTLPTTSSEWMTYSPAGDMNWSDLDLMLGGLDDPRTGIDPSLKAATSTGWSPDQFDMDVGSGRPNSTQRGTSAGDEQQQSGGGVGGGGGGGLGETAGNSKQQAKRQRLTQNLDTAESCIQELSKLNEALLREKNNLEDASEQGSQVSIGQILHHCEEFLSILRRLRWWSTCTNKSDSAASRTESEWSCLGDAADNSGSPSVSSSSKSPRTSPTPGVVLVGGGVGGGGAPPLEIPTLLSILSCYAYILQSYDSLLTPILDAVTRSAPTVPATLTGLHLDGFDLDGHNTLQLECWTSVSLNMLENMENILIGTPGQGGLISQAEGGLLRDKLSAALLDTLHDQNGRKVASPDSSGKREVRAKRLIREIRAALKVVDLRQR